MKKSRKSNHEKVLQGPTDSENYLVNCVQSLEDQIKKKSREIEHFIDLSNRIQKKIEIFDSERPLINSYLEGERKKYEKEGASLHGDNFGRIRQVTKAEAPKVSETTIVFQKYELYPIYEEDEDTSDKEILTHLPVFDKEAGQTQNLNASQIRMKKDKFDKAFLSYKLMQKFLRRKQKNISFINLQKLNSDNPDVMPPLVDRLLQRYLNCQAKYVKICQIQRRNNILAHYQNILHNVIKFGCYIQTIFAESQNIKLKQEFDKAYLKLIYMLVYTTRQIIPSDKYNKNLIDELKSRLVNFTQSMVFKCNQRDVRGSRRHFNCVLQYELQNIVDHMMDYVFYDPESETGPKLSEPPSLSFSGISTDTDPILSYIEASIQKYVRHLALEGRSRFSNAVDNLLQMNVQLKLNVLEISAHIDKLLVNFAPEKSLCLNKKEKISLIEEYLKQMTGPKLKTFAKDPDGKNLKNVVFFKTCLSSMKKNLMKMLRAGDKSASETLDNDVLTEMIKVIDLFNSTLEYFSEVPTGPAENYMPKVGEKCSELIENLYKSSKLLSDKLQRLKRKEEKFKALDQRIDSKFDELGVALAEMAEKQQKLDKNEKLKNTQGKELQLSSRDQKEAIKDTNDTDIGLDVDSDASDEFKSINMQAEEDFVPYILDTQKLDEAAYQPVSALSRDLSGESPLQKKISALRDNAQTLYRLNLAVLESKTTLKADQNAANEKINNLVKPIVFYDPPMNPLRSTSPTSFLSINDDKTDK